MNETGRRTLETVGVMMIGDGVLAALWPRRHMALWRSGPEPWRRAVRGLETRPLLTAALGAAEVALGVWLARSQFRNRDLLASK